MYKFRGDSCLGAKVQSIWCSEMGPVLFLKRESVRIALLHVEGESRLEQEVDVKGHTGTTLAGLCTCFDGSCCSLLPFFLLLFFFFP